MVVIPPSSATNWAHSGLVAAMFGNQEPVPGCVVITAFHFGSVDAGHWVAAYIDVDNRIVEVYDSAHVQGDEIKFYKSNPPTRLELTISHNSYHHHHYEVCGPAT
jgi:hypothetical protein